MVFERTISSEYAYRSLTFGVAFVSFRFLQNTPFGVLNRIK